MNDVHVSCDKVQLYAERSKQKMRRSSHISEG